MMTVTVTFVQTDGAERILNGQSGLTLMELGRGADVAGITGDCGGGCSCATCHVYIAPEWEDAVGKPDEIEATTLDMVSAVVKPNSRLGCQICLRDDLDGLRVEVAPYKGVR